MNGTDEFWKAISEFQPAVRKPIQYRAYYSKPDGKIITRACNPEDAEWPSGSYIVITKEQYNSIHPTFDIVVNGKIVRKKNDTVYSKRLVKDDNGRYTSLPNNIIFVAEKGDNYRIKEISND